jgi:hypothetical protein
MHEFPLLRAIFGGFPGAAKPLRRPSDSGQTLILSPAARSRASIDATNMAAWREAGAAGFGIGSAIYKSGDTPEMAAAKARALLSAASKS